MPSQSNLASTNIWHYKPWWCQPWSILLTGILLIGGSWLCFQRIWLTGLVAIPVLSWMGFFLLAYPQLMAQSGPLQAPLENLEDATPETTNQG